MSILRSVVLAAALMPMLGQMSASAEGPCRPRIEISNVQFSKVTNLKRYWTASANVDASKCSASSGLYAIRFLRWSESGPDIEFTEPFLWQRGETTVRVEFWADEAVGAYRIADVATCACKGE
jgi:hypothetical protein